MTPQPSWQAQGNLQLQRLHRNGGDRDSLQSNNRRVQSAADRPVQHDHASARFGNDRWGPRDGSNLERARSLAPGGAAKASTEEPVQAMCDACEAEEAAQDEQAGPTGEPVQAMGDPVETEAAETAESTEAEADDEQVQARCAACETEAAEPSQEDSVQEDGSGPSPGRNPALIHQEARRGLGNASQPLPHADRIQAAFGHHDISQVRAAVGGAAETANRRMGALAFASGDRIAFRQTPDLRLVAHEAAHVVQQREGLALPGNVGQPGDRWERHADSVADAVAAGRSAQDLLDQVAPPAAARGGPTAAGEAAAREPVQSRITSSAAHLGEEAVVQRDGTADAAVSPILERDAYYAQAVRNGEIDAMLVLGSVGSLVKLERIGPQCYPEVRKKLVDKYGERGVQGAYDSDSRIQALAAKSDRLTTKLSALRDEYVATGQVTARDLITTKIDAYEFTYAKIFVNVAKLGVGAINVLESYYNADAISMVEMMRAEAVAAQAEALRREAELAKWRKQGEQLIGQTVATRQRFAWWDSSITLTAVLAPTEGRETMAEAVAWGRLAGRACAIGKVAERFFVYESSDQFSYTDVFSADAFKDHRSEIVPESASGSGLPLITTEGYVLTKNGQRFFGGAQSKRPEDISPGTGALLHQADQLDADQAVRLFKMATMDLLMLNLAQAEERLRKVLLDVFPGVGFGTPMTMSVDYGKKVKTDAALLKTAMTRATDLINRKAGESKSDDAKSELDEEPTDAEEVQLMMDLETIGRIYTDNPGAAMMISSQRDPESTKPVAEGEIENRVQDKQAGDATWAVAEETRTRLENIQRIRNFYHGSLDETLSLEPLHDQLLPNFTGYQQLQIQLARAGHTFVGIAKTFGLTTLELLFLVTGALVGGPVGAGLAAGATGIGAGQALDGLREAKLTEARSKLDVPGGFQLSTEEEASTAKRWAYIGVALSVIDIGELATGNRLLRMVGRGAARVARGAGAVAIESLHWAKRVLGLPGDVIANLSLSGVRRLQSLSSEAVLTFSRLSNTLKRILLGCASPCRVDLAEIYRYLNDPARSITTSTKGLNTIDEVIAALPPSSKFNRKAIRQYLKDHPSALEFIRQSGISADDLSGLTALDVVSRGDLSEATARKTFSRYLTSLVPAKIGPDITEFNRIAEAAGKVEVAGAANALKGSMFENFARLYVTDFRTANLGRKVYTYAMINGLESSSRSSDAWVSQFGELWDFKHIAGAVDPSQVRDYQRILKYEARKASPQVTSINYLFPTREAAEANRALVTMKGFKAWYLGPSGRRIMLR